MHAISMSMSSSSCTPRRLLFWLNLHILVLLLQSCSCSCYAHPNADAFITRLLHANATDGALRRYLARFGYQEGQAADHQSDLLKLYQSTLGLPVTGRLDAPTIDLLATPRCAVPDLHHGHAAAAASRFAYFAGQPRWARAPGHFLLTYSITTTGVAPYLPPRKAVRAAFRRAFARWARVIPVRFVETRDYNLADVKVGFFLGDHGDGEPFDGPLGVLGHAFSPPSGQLHLDGAERWAVDLGADGDPAAVDLESVATHEIGHVLGLAHSASPEAVMYPSLKPRTRKVDLTVDDVRGVQALYGSNPQFSLSSLSEPDTSSAAHGTSRTPSMAILLLVVAIVTFLSVSSPTALAKLLDTIYTDTTFNYVITKN